MNNTARSGDLMGAAAPGALARREQLSALADGELAGEELVQALEYAAQAEGESTWQLYHLVGDVLRSPDLAKPPAPDFLARLRLELAKETPAGRPDFRQQMTEVVAAPMVESANASVFRWKMVAGVASLAAVAAIGWTSLGALQGSGGATGGAAQLALSAEPSPGSAGSPVVAVADAEGQQVMIRDPRLDELLAAHKQFGSTSALQMPAGFLRNATFEAPSR
jgi:sigma-E factor negative regulatory protein RseA